MFIFVGVFLWPPSSFHREEGLIFTICNIRIWYFWETCFLFPYLSIFAVSSLLSVSFLILEIKLFLHFHFCSYYTSSCKRQRNYNFNYLYLTFLIKYFHICSYCIFTGEQLLWETEKDVCRHQSGNSGLSLQPQYLFRLFFASLLFWAFFFKCLFNHNTFFGFYLKILFIHIIFLAFSLKCNFCNIFFVG